MSYLITRHGRRIDLPSPKPAQIHIEDIAAQLAVLPRFCGATMAPYTVAEHSVHVMMLAREHGAGHTLQMAALLHDAHEAYMGDIPSPVKALCGPGLKSFEDTLQRAVLARFGLTTVYECCRDEIKRWDLIALATERRDLMHPNAMASPWETLNGIEPDPYRLPRSSVRRDPRAVEGHFMCIYQSLSPIVFPAE